MKKVSRSFLVATLFPSFVFATDIQTPLSALPNNFEASEQKIIVAEFDNLSGIIGQNPRKMTIKEFFSIRPTIGSAVEKKLCTVESIANPERISGGLCVAMNVPALITVATFKNATGAPINDERTMAVKDFIANASRVQAKGNTNYNCIIKNGVNSGVCVITNTN